jgi:hypothetical protein
MGAIEDEKAYALLIRESADDGSDFTNPPADYRRLFVGEDGDIHLKDPAGTVTDFPAGGGGGGSGAITLVRNTAQRDSSSTSFADVTGLTFAVSSGVTYRFRFVVFFFTAVNTTALRLAVNGPAMTSIRYGGFIPTAAASNSVSIANGQISVVDNSIVSTTGGPGGSGVMAIVEGTCIPSASGTLALRFASEVGGSTVSIEAGSYGELIEF